MNGIDCIESYEAPKVVTIEVEVEKGYATSFDGEGGNWK